MRQLDIAQHGYSYVPNRMSSVAYFPAYPLTMRVVQVLVRDETLAGVLLSALCGLGAVVLVYRWCRSRCCRTSPASGPHISPKKAPASTFIT